MKKLVILILEVESDDEVNMKDEFIRHDLEGEIKCCSNFYEISTFGTLEIDEDTKKEKI